MTGAAHGAAPGAAPGPSPWPDGASVHVVGALLLRGGRVLLGHRSPERRWFPDVWDIPGGHVEPGEPPADAMRRELHEELGVEPTTSAHLTTVRVGEVVIDVWTVTAWTGTPVNREPREHDALAWFGPDDLPVATLAHPGLEAVLRAALTPGGVAAGGATAG